MKLRPESVREAPPETQAVVPQPATGPVRVGGGSVTQAQVQRSTRPAEWATRSCCNRRRRRQ